MRSVKKPTPVSAVTATSSAASSTASSPERQSRESASNAKRSALIGFTSLPGVQLDHAVAARRDRAVVGHEHERRAVRGIEVEQELDHARAGRRVEVAGRLVGEQHGGPRHEGARDRDALLLAAGELARVVAEPRAEADLLEHRPRAGARIAPAGELERQHHVLVRRQRRHEVEGLEHEADVAGARLGAAVLVERRELDALEPDAARARLVEAGEQREQRGFPGARRRRRRRRFRRPPTARLTSSRMVSIPSGLVTSLRKLLASRTVFLSMLRVLVLALLLAARGAARAVRRTAGDPRPGRFAVRRLRARARPGLGVPAAAAIEEGRLRTPRRQRQRQRRDDRRRRRPARPRARDAQARHRDPGARRQRRPARAAGVARRSRTSGY